MYYIKQDLASGDVNRRVIAEPFFCDNCGLPAVSHLANYEPASNVVQDQYLDPFTRELVDNGDPEVAQVSTISCTQKRLAASLRITSPHQLSILPPMTVRTLTQRPP